MKKAFGLALAATLAACTATSPEPTATVTEYDRADQARLAEVLEQQDDAIKVRYQYRHPQETLSFFGIMPGMTVVEALPGEGWYSKILLPYLGSEGHLIGIDYHAGVWPNFPFADDDFLAQKSQWSTQWPIDARPWGGDDGAGVSAYTFDAIPSELAGTVDAVLFIRALQNLARFEDQGQYLTSAFQAAYDLLKPGGVVGIVQHEAAEDKSDDWADGSRGYLKAAFVMERMKQAGFEFVDKTDINKNPADQPGDNDVVWRLPPSLATSQDDEELKAQYLAVGESTRVTLRFRKPIVDLNR